MKRIETDRRKLVDALEATLDDPAGVRGLAAHLADLPDWLDASTAGLECGREMVVLIDQSARLLSQNASAAQRLGLTLGAALTEVALSPQSGARFIDDLKSTQGPVTLAIASQSGETVFLLGQRTESGGPFLMSEVQRGLSAKMRSHLAAAMGLIPSEAMLLDGLLRGTPTDRIAADLGRTEGTVRQQIKSIMAKTGVHSQTQLVSTAYAFASAYGRIAHRQPALAPASGPHFGAELFTGQHGTMGLHSLGPMKGMPVLLLHGALFGIAASPSMRIAAETLGLRLIAPERPGYGHTLFPTSQDPVSLCCAQICDLLDSLGIDRVVVLAHDIGTRFAARLAQIAPTRVAAVVAAPATPPMRTWSQTSDMPTRHRVNAWAAQQMPGLMDKIVMIGLRQIARKGIEVIPQLVFEGCHDDQAVLQRPDASDALQEGFHLAWAQFGAGFRHDMRLTNENWAQEAARVSVPFLCMHGALSKTVSRNAVEHLAKTLPSGRFLLVEDAGHSMPLSHPALLLRAAVAAGQSAGLGQTEFEM